MFSGLQASRIDACAVSIEAIACWRLRLELVTTLELTTLELVSNLETYSRVLGWTWEGWPAGVHLRRTAGSRSREQRIAEPLT